MSAEPGRPKSVETLADAVFIGYMVGTYHVIGRGGTQAIANLAGEYVGRELFQFAQDHGHNLATLDDLRQFLQDSRLAGYVALQDAGDQIIVVIGDCHICPKRVGQHQFEGTACPWGGLLTGLLTAMLDQRFSCAVRLVPAATCKIALTKK